MLWAIAIEVGRESVGCVFDLGPTLGNCLPVRVGTIAIALITGDHEWHVPKRIKSGCHRWLPHRPDRWANHRHRLCADRNRPPGIEPGPGKSTSEPDRLPLRPAAGHPGQSWMNLSTGLAARLDRAVKW